MDKEKYEYFFTHKSRITFGYVIAQFLLKYIIFVI